MKNWNDKPHLRLIRLIGVIVPRRLRADWRQEWTAELHHHETLLSQWDKLDWRNKLNLLWHSVGAFADALWLQPKRLEEEMFQDLRFGVRMLLRHRGFTLAAVLALALGIGANTAVFSVVNAVLLRPLPFQNSERMVLLWGNFLKFGIEQSRAKAAEYLDYRDRTKSFEQVAAFHTDDFNVTGEGRPARVAGAAVTANLFPLLGANAAEGRLISAEENQAGRNNVVVISQRFREQRLGNATNVVNSNIRLNDQQFTVIGVMPAGFEFPHPSFNFAEPVEFWIPLAFTTEQVAQRQRPYYLNVVGLLKPGVTVEQARTEMTALGQSFEQKHQSYRGPNNSDMGWRITVVPLLEQIVGNSRRALLVLFAAVGLVLLIACANAANLLLMRATVRQKELAVRSAMGASRLRLMRQLLTESLLIGGLGGVCGLALAWWGVKALVALSPENLPRLREINVDGRVLLFTFATSLLTSLVFGIAPALQASKPELQQTLKEGGVAATRKRHWLRNALVVSEVAIAALLLIGAGLMLNSFLRLQRINPVVTTDKLLSVELNLPAAKYSEPAQAAAFYQELVRKVEGLPGVESASLSTIQALSGAAMNDPFAIEGRPLDFNNPFVAGWQLVAPNHFRTLGIPIVAGRDFTERDNTEAAQSGNGAAIINEALAARYFPGENPIGKRLTLGLPRADNPWLTIVGVVKNIPHRGLESKAEPDWYLPYLSRPRRDAFLMIRSSATPAGLAAAVRDKLSELDQDQPVTAVKTMNEVIAATTAPRRFNTLLLTIFAALALLLAAVGIYSVMSYSVAQRTREIGIRLALGATAADVVRLIVRQGMMPALVGVVIGVGGAVAAARAIRGLLYDTSATDPATFLTLALTLLLVALSACWLPARRAARVNPMDALRQD